AGQDRPSFSDLGRGGHRARGLQRELRQRWGIDHTRKGGRL
ncbi:hypothetical protein AVDCRST_MAG82-540, partial [uncultured Rubrobacteraceae bacterium]